MSAGWTDGLLDELAEQLATHPRLQALVQARVEQSLAEHELHQRSWLTLT
jgi:hypothetical protein